MWRINVEVKGNKIKQNKKHLNSSSWRIYLFLSSIWTRLVGSSSVMTWLDLWKKDILLSLLNNPVRVTCVCSLFWFKLTTFGKASLGASHPLDVYKLARPSWFPPFLPSLALFAYWLRSSVVSVLFSLITKSFPLGCIMIILIFVPRRGASGLAHVPCHCVTGISLPPVDANIFSLLILLARTAKRILNYQAFKIGVRE